MKHSWYHRLRIRAARSARRAHRIALAYIGIAPTPQSSKQVDIYAAKEERNAELACKAAGRLSPGTRPTLPQPQPQRPCGRFVSPVIGAPSRPPTRPSVQLCLTTTPPHQQQPTLEQSAKSIKRS
jgi:hypothetical protein